MGWRKPGVTMRNLAPTPEIRSPSPAQVLRERGWGEGAPRATPSIRPYLPQSASPGEVAGGEGSLPGYSSDMNASAVPCGSLRLTTWLSFISMTRHRGSERTRSTCRT